MLLAFSPTDSAEMMYMRPAHDLFETLRSFDLGNSRQGWFYSLLQLEVAGVGPISKLPVSIRLVLESVLRNCDGKKVHAANVKELANWKPTGTRTAEIPFIVARIVLQDFTGVPLLVDLAAMRSAAARMARTPKSSSRWCRWTSSWTTRCRWTSRVQPTR